MGSAKVANEAYAAGKMDAINGKPKDRSWSQTDYWAEYDRGFANYSN